MELMQSRVLAQRYEVRERLGAGASAEVWAAWDRRVGRSVAIKVLLGDLAGAGVDVELAALAALRHPNIVAVYDVGEDPQGRPFLVLERVGGATLAELMDRSGGLAPDRAARLFAQVAEGLAAGHAAGIVHGDVKPANLRVEADHAGRERVWLLDFGLAGGVPEGGSGGDRLPRGTPRYMAPEVVGGAPPGPAADLYSLGASLYEALTGVAPFEDTELAVLLEAQRERQAVPAEVLCPAVGAALAELVGSLLAKDPHGRPAAAADVAQRLVACASIGADPPAAGMAVPVGADGAPPAATRTGARGWLPAVVGVGLLAVGALVWWLWPRVPAAGRGGASEPLSPATAPAVPSGVGVGAELPSSDPGDAGSNDPTARLAPAPTPGASPDPADAARPASVQAPRSEPPRPRPRRRPPASAPAVRSSARERSAIPAAERADRLPPPVGRASAKDGLTRRGQIGAEAPAPGQAPSEETRGAAAPPSGSSPAADAP